MTTFEWLEIKTFKNRQIAHLDAGNTPEAKK